jgi:hypothetical protein
VQKKYSPWGHFFPCPRVISYSRNIPPSTYEHSVILLQSEHSALHIRTLGHFLTIGTFRPPHVNTPSFCYSRKITPCTNEHSVILLHMHVPLHVPVLVPFMFRCMFSHLFQNMFYWIVRCVFWFVFQHLLFLCLCPIYLLFHVPMHVASHICHIYISGVCSAAFVLHVRCVFLRISRRLFRCMFRTCSAAAAPTSHIPSYLLHSVFLCMLFFKTFTGMFLRMSRREYSMALLHYSA